jgi:eukaryotic-like serine/threonine-protein kinase
MHAAPRSFLVSQCVACYDELRRASCRGPGSDPFGLRMLQLTQLGPYQIGKPIGKGGMGSVYEATDAQTGQKVAVKALNPHLAQVDGFRERFEAEIESLKTLRHEGIVRLFGYGEQDGVLFYSMEIIPGASLEDELREGRRFDWREVSDIAIQLSMALKHAHDHGIIHRDIKPANVLFADDQHVKLADFGIARLFGTNNSLTSAGGVLGTADYMSPEQADGRPVNARCDQYSLGGVMYALLTGRPPFRAKNLPEMLQLQRYAQPEPVSRYAPDTPKQLEQVIMQLLAKDPADRFPNTAVLARHLQAMVKALSRPPHDGFALSSDPAEPLTTEPDWRDPLALAVTQAETVPLPAIDLQSPPANGQSLVGPADPSRDAATRAADSLIAAQAQQPSITPFSPSPSPTAVPSPAPAGTTIFTNIDDEYARQQQQQPRSWLTILAPLAALMLTVVGLISLAIYLSRPYTSDQLYAKITTHADSDDVESIRTVELEIQEFIARFPVDSRAAELRNYQERVELERMSRRLQLQARRGGLSDPSLLPVEVLYLRAMNVAQSSPEAAIAMLESLINLYQPDAITDRAASTGNEVSASSSAKRDDTLERRARCVQLAKQQLTSLRDDFDKQVARQLGVIRERLATAEKIADLDPSHAREMLQAIIDLYGKESWASEVVAQARKQIEGLKLPPKSPDAKQTGQPTAG